MEFYPTEIAAVVRLVPKIFKDDRGEFSEIFNLRRIAEGLGIDLPFVQDNLSRSTHAGTVRALHFQAPPIAQGKLVRVAKGAILDIAVDVRKGSPSYGQHVAVELSEDKMDMLWVPPGFAHGYVTRQPNTEVTYKTTDYFSPDHEVGMRWDDPDLGIDWGLGGQKAILSERDRDLPPYATLDSPF